MALTGDLMVRFNEWNVEQYRLFAIRTAVAPAGLRTPVPAFWTPGEQIGRFQIYQVPNTGYFDLVDVPVAAAVARDTFFEVNDRWLASDWVGRRDHLWLDWHGDAPLGMPRLAPGAALPAVPSDGSEPGRILSERQDGEVYQAECEAARPSYVLFKMTWHPNWKVYIDGAPVPTVMLSPGFLGAPVSAGRHRIVCRYESGGLKAGLAILGLVMLLVTGRGRPFGAAG
jgi:hypothetical protein